MLDLRNNDSARIIDRLSSKKMLDYFSGKRDNISFKFMMIAMGIHSMSKYQVYSFLKVFVSLARINIPIHVLPFLIFKLKSLKEKWKAKKALVRLIVNMLRSIMFMTCYVASIRLME